MIRKTLLKVAVALTLLLGVLSVAAFPRSHVAASPPAVTYGDVQAIFDSQAIPLGIILHNHQPVGAPNEEFARATITPLSSHNGEHKCVEDWHLVRVTAIVVVDGVFFSTKEQAIADLQATSISFTLDGVSLPVEQTPINQLNVADQKLFGLPGTGFDFGSGSILAPDVLGVGTHTAGLTVSDPVFGFFQDSSTFTVDPAGTGACLAG